MMNFAEYRSKSACLADFLPWVALVGEGVVLNKDGSLQRTARFRGPDLDSATPAELVAVTSRLNNALRRLGSGWAVFVEAQRLPASDYPQSAFPDPASALVDMERREQFREEGAHFESRYFLTLLWMPPAEDASRAEAWLYEGMARSGVDPREHVASFIDRTNRVLHLVEGFMPEAEWLDDGATLTYLHSTVSTKRQRVRVPETPVYLDALLTDQALVGGLEPRLGAMHLRTLTITGFPSATWPGLLDELNRLAFSYRWSTRAIMLDKTDATKLLTKIRRQWFAKRKSIAAILKEVMTNEQSVLMDSDASNKAADADIALQELGADHAGIAYVTATVTVWDADPALAAEKLRLVEKVIQGRDFTCTIEGMNAIEAWLGSLPGHVYANVRQPPISTLNLAHLIPLSAVWAGAERDEHFGDAPLLYGKTEGSTPFRLSLHVGDVGHCLIVGPTGAGKSVLLATMAMQFRRYPGAQIFAFDFGGSIRAAALAMGGDWQDLGGALHDDEGGVALQPLARIDEAAERSWAAEWLAAMLAGEGVEVDPAAKEHLWSALTSLATAPVSERTLTGLAVLLQSIELKQALAPYLVGGPWGRLLDADEEKLGEALVQVFETEGLVGAASAGAVLSYLFHRIAGRLDGSPTLIIIDEGWLVLDSPAFAAQLREWLKTLRKKNASVVFATQSLADIETSSIAPAIVESCPTRIFLPNERALEPQIARIYERFGLNDRQVEILSRATPKRDYYCQSRRGNRLFDLGLGDIALAFTAASSKTDQTRIGELFAAHGRAGFAAAWLLHRKLEWATELLPLSLLAGAAAIALPLHAAPADPRTQVGRANDAARVQPERTTFRGAIQQYAWAEGALFQVYTAPGQVTDIVLQEGEDLIGPGPVAAGDTVRWIIGDTLSGEGTSRRVHILVKPTRPDITTNLIINTSRRTYHLELRATPATYMAAVSWNYPADELIALRAAEAERARAAPVAGGIDLPSLNFGYRIGGDKVVWRPIRAFDDGRQLFIEFGPAVATGEMPPLFAVGEKGSAELLNYRVDGRFMIVDRLLERGELRLGAGKAAKTVRIVRDAPTRRVRP